MLLSRSRCRATQSPLEILASTSLCSTVPYSRRTRPTNVFSESFLNFRRYSTSPIAYLSSSYLRSSNLVQSRAELGNGRTSVAQKNNSDGEGFTRLDTTEQVQEEVKRALRSEDHDALVVAFIRLSQQADNLRALPSTFLVEILRTLKPRYFLDPAKLAYRGIHPSVIQNLREPTRQLKDIFIDYTRSIRALSAQIRQAGKQIGVPGYTNLLDAAKATGDAELAIQLLASMRQDGIEPDVTCYNYYFEALAWNDAYEPIESHNLRVTTRNLQIKEKSDGSPSNSGRNIIGPRRLRTFVLDTYEAMLLEGTGANINTYCYFIQMMSRHGDIGAVKAVLLKVWEVDVDSVMKDEEGSSLFESTLAPDSPLYPNQDLLFTIAHIFGSNNQISTALRLVDHVARKFDLKIGLETWLQLAQWTYVLQTKRYGRGDKLKRREVESIGQIPLESFENLWQIMTSEPYNVKPTELLYNMRIRSFWRRDLRPDMVTAMNEARSLLHPSVTSRPTLEDYSKYEFFMEPTDRTELRRTLWTRTFSLFQQWTKLALTPWFSNHPLRPDWNPRDLPKFLESWSESVSGIGAAYSIETGRVQFHPTHKVPPVYVTMEIVRKTSDEIIVKPTKFYDTKPYLGLTRFARLSRRHEMRQKRRTFSPYDDAQEQPNFEYRAREPGFIPMWHETEEVKDWTPPKEGEIQTEDVSTVN